MENIRSYGNLERPIHFPHGVTLFEGDMHAGKSTLLYAIEFALFGLGEFRGSFLLRNGCQRGSVTLVFEEKGQVYEVYRSLIKKQKGIQQDECFVKGPSGKQILAPTDLKDKILKILGFNEPPNPKSQSVIYRYAIFTPQEQMKEVMNKNPDDRLQTLRKAFRIEDYKIAAQNCGVLLDRVHKKISYLKAATEDLHQIKSELSNVTIEVDRIVKAMKPLENKAYTLTENMKDMERKRIGLDKERETIDKIVDKIPLYTKQITDKELEISNNKKEIEKIQQKINAIDYQIDKLKKMKKPTDFSISQMENQIKDLIEKIDHERDNKQVASQARSRTPLLKVALNKAISNINIKNDEISKKEKIRKDLLLEIKKLELIRKPTNKTETTLKDERFELAREQKNVENQLSKFEERISNFSSLMEKKKCPICERNVNTADYLDKKSSLTTEYAKMKKSSELLSRQLKDIDGLIEDLAKFNQTDKQCHDLKSQLKDPEEVISSSTRQLGELQIEKRDLENQIKATEKEAGKEIAAQEKIDKLVKSKDQISLLVENLKNYQQSQKDLEKMIYDKDENSDTMNRYKSISGRLEREKRIADNLLQDAQKNIRPLDTILEKLNNLKIEMKKTETSLKVVRDQLTSSKTSLLHITQNKNKLKIDVESKEKKLQIINLLSEHKIWLEEYFSLGIDNIERHVMESIRRRFDSQFQRWFEILVEDPALQVRVNEEFTAQIDREGFDQDYLQLSGGERTSVALAYRLALNTIVQEVCTGGVSNLLILDEPTDGFSKQQLYKLRDVFRELKCPQVIIVSHEREMEGFADSIIRVQNKNGMSVINFN